MFPLLGHGPILPGLLAIAMGLMNHYSDLEAEAIRRWHARERELPDRNGFGGARALAVEHARDVTPGSRGSVRTSAEPRVDLGPLRASSSFW